METHLLRLSRVLAHHGAEITIAARIVHGEPPLDQFRELENARFLSTPFSEHLDWPRAAMAWALYAWPMMLPDDFDVLYSFDMSRLITVLRRRVKPEGYAIANRVGEVPEDSRIADPAVEAVFDGFITETETQIAGYKSSLPMRAIPLMGQEPKSLARRERRPDDKLRVGYLGRYETLKGILRLVDIWREARPQNAELAFYGRGIHRAQLEHYIRESGMAAQVTVNEGWSTSERQAEIFQQIDLLMLPSDSEGFPLILLEAMAHGVPFLATDIGATRELTRDNPDVAVLPLDVPVFARAMLDMLDRIRCGEVSAERLRRYYDARYNTAKTAEQYRQALLEPERFWGPRRMRASRG